MNELISVIIPAYNCESTIEKTIMSVINQTFSNFEVIVVNDGSLDNTLEIIEKIAENIPTIKFFSKENGGVSSARNLGISHSSGKYISFLDADDYFENNFLEVMHKKIYSTKSDVVCCGYYNLTNKGKFKQKSFFTEKDILKNYLIGNNKFHTSTWLIRKELLINNNILFNETYSWGEDVEFFCKVLNNSSKTSIVKDYLTVYKNDEINDRLSSFKLNKMDLDYDLLNHMLENNNFSESVENAILGYRLPALLNYRLLEAFRNGTSKEEIILYYDKYKNIINEFSNKYGIQSIKLKLSNYKLRKLLRQIMIRR